MDIILPIVAALLGSVLASFIGVLAERSGTNESWVHGRSRCNSCGETLAAHDLVPITSWLSTWGRCGYCSSKLPVTYVVSEIALALTFYFAASILGPTPVLLAFLASVSVLAFIVLYDLRHMIVPLSASGVFIVAGLSTSYLRTGSLSVFGLDVLVAGSVGFLFFLSFYLSRGRVMGLGDAPVVIGLALMTGAHYVLPGIVFAFWIGALFGIGVLVRKPKGHRMGIEVPFVPFLAAGFLLAYFSGWNPFLL